jgi:quercetin dioxygenase-like cupin family protein
MFKQIRFVIGVFLTVLGASAMAQSGTQPALAFADSDPTLQWGPCPDFMPTGCQIAVLHGDPSKPNADVFFKVPANATIASHWHSSAERMVLVAGELQVTYDGQEPTTLRPGMYAYGPAKLPHKAVCGQSDACILFIAFEGPVDAVPTERMKK